MICVGEEKRAGRAGLENLGTAVRREVSRTPLASRDSVSVLHARIALEFIVRRNLSAAERVSRNGVTNIIDVHEADPVTAMDLRDDRIETGKLAQFRARVRFKIVVHLYFDQAVLCRSAVRMGGLLRVHRVLRDSRRGGKQPGES